MRFSVFFGKNARSYPCTRRRPRPNRGMLFAPPCGTCACLICIVVLLLLLCCLPQWVCCVVAVAALALLVCVL